MASQEVVARIAKLNDQQPPYYDFEGDLKNATEKSVEETKTKLKESTKKVFPKLESSSEPDLSKSISKMSQLFISDHCDNLQTALMEFLNKEKTLTMNEPRNLDAQLQTINQKFTNFTSEYQDFYKAGTNLKLIKYLIKKHYLRPLSKIFNEHEINIFQEEFLRILNLPEFNRTTVQELFTALKSLLICTSGNTSKLDRQTKSKIDAITVPTKLSTFSLYTSIGELRRINHFDDERDPSKLNIMHININSLQAHFNTFRLKLTRFKRLPDIIAVTETFFTQSDINQSFLNRHEIPHFKLYIPENHRSTKGGGVAMYVNENFEIQQREDLAAWEEKVYESLFLDIKAGAFSFVCGVIYKTQRSSNERFREKLNNSLTRIAQENQIAAICGDFNHNLLPKKTSSPNKILLRDFKMIMVKHNYVPCIIRLTRYEKRTSSSANNAPNNSEESVSSNEDDNSDENDSLPNGTLIDHIWFNKVELVLNSAILVDYFGSDHLAVCCSIKTYEPSAITNIESRNRDNSFPRILEVYGDPEKISNEKEELLEHLNYLLTLSKSSKENLKKKREEIEKANLNFF